MVKHSNKLKRADRRAPDPGLKVDFEPTPTAASDAPAASEPYKPFQHSQQAQAPSKKSKSASNGASALSKAARAKKAKAVERADKTNQKFVVNKAKAERKKLMKA